MSKKKSFGTRDKTVRKTPLPPKARKANPTNDAPDEKAMAYRERACRERERFALATDGDFWLAVCFKDQDGMDEFAAEFGFGEQHARYWIHDLDLTKWKPDKPKRTFATIPPPRNVPKVPDPFETVEYTEDGDVEEDSKRELAALLQAMKDAKPAQPLREVRFSDKYFVLIFESVPAKEKWLEQVGLGPLRQKYLDGAAVQRTLRRNHVQRST